MVTLLGSLVDRALGLAEAPRPRALSRFETSPDLAIGGLLDRRASSDHGEAESSSRAAPEALPLAAILRPAVSDRRAANDPPGVAASSVAGPAYAARRQPDEWVTRQRRPDPATTGDRALGAQPERDRSTAAGDVPPAEPRRPAPTIGSATVSMPGGRPARHEIAAAPSIEPAQRDGDISADRRPPTNPAEVRPRATAAVPDPARIGPRSRSSIDPHPVGPIPTRPASGSAGDPIRPSEPASELAAATLIRPAAPRRTTDDGHDAWPDGRPSSRADAPVIRVSIGRIEVRAVTAPAPAVRRPATPSRDSGPSLEDYLRARNGRS